MANANPFEFLASFSQPNASALSPILVKASEILKVKELGSLSGYQERDRDSVLSPTECLMEVSYLQQDIHYIVNPASFVKSGQRIRLPKQIFDEKLACCLDTTIFLSALAEQIGLKDTLLVVEEGHAYRRGMVK